jgi:hypothetical protein
MNVASKKRRDAQQNGQVQEQQSEEFCIHQNFSGLKSASSKYKNKSAAMMPLSQYNQVMGGPPQRGRQSNEPERSSDLPWRQKGRDKQHPCGFLLESNAFFEQTVWCSRVRYSSLRTCEAKDREKQMQSQKPVKNKARDSAR